MEDTKVKTTNYLQILKFAVAGATGAAVEISLFILLFETSGLHYMVASFIAISVAIVVNYFISQKWVFETGRYSKKVEFTMFLVVSMVALVFNQLLMWGFVDFVYLDPKISKVFAIGIVAIFNFVAKKFFVFKR